MNEPGLTRKKRIGCYGQPPYDRESIERVREFWNLGLSASMIGSYCGVTKNVVIGIAHRNDFPSRPSPIIRDLSGQE